MLRSVITLLLASGILLLSCTDESHKTIKRGIVGGIVRGNDYSLQNVYGWEERSEFMLRDKVLVSPEESPTDEMQENVSVTLSQISRGVSTEECLQASIDSFKELLSPENEFSYSPTKVGDLDGYVAHVRYRMEDSDIAMDSYLVFANSRAYMVQCIALERTYLEFKPKFDAIVRTFSLK